MVFTDFFYFLRLNGISVSLNEWLILMEALEKGLAHESFLEFYYLSRAVLVKSEADFDKFDLAFSSYFQAITPERGLPEDILSYLENPIDMQPFDKEEVDKRTTLEMEELQKLLEQRLREQIGAHNGGTRWIGTGGTSPLGNSGYSASGIRVGDHAKNKTALQVASEREYRDFREDETVGVRQFQMAFRKLRQFSLLEEGPKDELQVERSIDETCKNGGNLKLVFDHPRKNGIKLMILFDSGGSMEPYAKLCSKLFQAVSKANHFKDLKIYYFHNCPYNRLYHTPGCDFSQSVDTQWVLDNIKSDYKVIMVGDASMALWEMRYYVGGRKGKVTDRTTGVYWLNKFARRYKNIIWFNPIPAEEWEHVRGRETIKRIRSVIPMYHLSLKGMERGLKALIAAR